jgi:hypothetical protein
MGYSVVGRVLIPSQSGDVSEPNKNRQGDAVYGIHSESSRADLPTIDNTKTVEVNREKGIRFFLIHPGMRSIGDGVSDPGWSAAETRTGGEVIRPEE